MRSLLTLILAVLIIRTYGEFSCNENSVKVNDELNKKSWNTNSSNTDKINKEIKKCICHKQKCVRKCCPFGYGFKASNKTCVPIKEDFDLPLYDNINRVVKGATARDQLHFVIGTVSCKPPALRIRVRNAADVFHVRQDGQLYIEVPKSVPPWVLKTVDQYCIDTFVSSDSEKGNTTQLDALICFGDKEPENHYLLSSTCMLISCVFIIATVAVYVWLPELRNLHGKVLMACLLCFLVGFSFMATMQILLLIDNITQNTCLGLTFVIYFALLSAFFWLNVMCFDIWWTFSGKRGISREKWSSQARFRLYCIYAFSIPTALTILLASLEFADLEPHPLLPLLNDHGCFLNGTSKLIYLYGPITTLCVANMTFFVLTALKIAQINKQTAVLKSKESSTHDQHRNDKQRLLLYVKLFAVMGINWILEVVSAFYPDANNIWRFTDAYNVLLGVIIFIIFVCKRKIFKLIKKRYAQLKGEPLSTTQTTASSRTYSSRDETIQMSVKN